MHAPCKGRLQRWTGPQIVVVKNAELKYRNLIGLEGLGKLNLRVLARVRRSRYDSECLRRSTQARQRAGGNLDGGSCTVVLRRVGYQRTIDRLSAVGHIRRRLSG